MPGYAVSDFIPNTRRLWGDPQGYQTIGPPKPIFIFDGKKMIPVDELPGEFKVEGPRGEVGRD